ncbi:phosphotransferase [Streptomyces alfalfae]|uniref:Aminoglycoside phosphotransferase family protein n=1 Tax=Streptomyces alfalfae TaxID=1642299 RepID=A0A7T4PBZ8_9ACTN|nr:phosphotransferase [Streptomyces alfalfae]QQC87357.1 aminoglycoside phosphotransferase family protein [Streptomyces alfalfae]
MQWTPRLPWQALPDDLRRRVEERLGAPVTGVDAVTGGFSAGFAGVVRTEHGPAFLKATSETVNSHGRALYRQEHSACRLLSATRASVGFLWGLDHQDWTVLAFRAVKGSICGPGWPPGQLDAVLRLLRETRITAPAALPPVTTLLREAFDAWPALAADPAFDAWPTDATGAALLPAQRWVALAEQARHAFTGDELLHADLRADNILWSDTGPVLVDWAYACRGAAAFDPIYLLLEVARVNGRPPEAELAQVVTAYGCADEDATALLAVFGGWFTWMSRMPPIPALPTLRDFQKDMARTAIEWVGARLPDRTQP